MSDQAGITKITAAGGRTSAWKSAAETEEDDLDWAARSKMWETRNATPLRRLAKRERSPEPLILCGHGVSLRVEAGTLLIRNGFTHYPQKQETFRFFKRDPELPSRIIMLDGSGTISFDVLTWLAQQKLPLVRIDWTGAVVVVSSFEGFAGDQRRVSWQLETRNDPKLKMQFCNALIAEKIRGCAQTLEKYVWPSEERDKALEHANADITKLETRPPTDVETLRWLEARSAVAYFRAWRKIPIRWKSSARHPIPNEWREFSSRSSRLHQAGNRNASHPVNAMLNFAYSVLQATVQIKTVSEGYDPNLGIMHFDREYGSTFVFDLMEVERPKVDRAIISFLKTETLHPSDFVLRVDGVVRLNPQFARQIVRLAHGQTLSAP